MTNLWLSFAAIGALLAAAGGACHGFAGLLLLPPANRAERASWAVALGLALLSVSVPLALLVHLPPRWTALALIAASAAFSLSRRERGGSGGLPPLTSAPAATEGRVSRSERPAGVSETQAAPSPKSKIQNPKSVLLLLLLIGFGIAAYLIPSLSEPMWSNDFLGIWGFKGKAIFTAGAIPRWLFTDTSVASSHPEYPLGLPFLYAAISFVLGRWDDQAMAILFPFIQAATLLGLFGWLRRRGASPILAFAAAAVLANFIPLYSPFYAGLADVPYSFATLLFGAAFADAVEGTDARAPARLALAATLAISTKNEGLLLAGAGVLLWLFRRRNAAARSRGVFLAIAIPAVVLSLVGRIAKGSLPLRDFDFGYLGPTLILEFLPRVAEALHSGFREVILPSWAGILCLAGLIAAGRQEASGNRMLALAGFCSLVYLLVPALAVLGPEWLIRTSLVRTTSALAPLVAAAVAIRLKP